VPVETNIAIILRRLLHKETPKSERSHRLPSEKVQGIKKQLWQEERERLFNLPAMWGAYHVEALKQLGEAPLLSSVLRLEKYSLDPIEGDQFISLNNKDVKVTEFPVDPQIIATYQGSKYKLPKAEYTYVTGRTCTI